MKRLSILTVGAGLGLTAWLVSAPALLGQTFYSFAGGLNVARRVPVDAYEVFHGSTSHGFAVQGSVGRHVTRRVGWRLDVFVSQFDLTQRSDFAGVLCEYNPPPGTCCGFCPRGTSKGLVGVTGLAVSEFVNVVPSAFGLGIYLIGGAETDYLYKHPTAQGALRLGLSAGAGVEGPAGSRLLGFVEARYHALVSAPSQPNWFAPVIFGLRF